MYIILLICEQYPRNLVSISIFAVQILQQPYKDFANSNDSDPPASAGGSLSSL